MKDREEQATAAIATFEMVTSRNDAEALETVRRVAKELKMHAIAGYLCEGSIRDATLLGPLRWLGTCE